MAFPIPMLDRLPSKGPILAFAVLAASLWLTARLAGRGVESAKSLGESVARPAALDPDLEAALPREFAAALRGAAGLAKAEGNSGAATPGGAPGEDGGVEADGGPETGSGEGSTRPPGRVYPAFDPAGRGGHGVPEGPLPRNIGLRFVDGRGDLLYPDGVQGTQTGQDGEFSVWAYRSSADLAWWTLGSPALTQGAKASFTLEVTARGDVWTGSFELDDVPRSIDSDRAEPIELTPRCSGG